MATAKITITMDLTVDYDEDEVPDGMEAEEWLSPTPSQVSEAGILRLSFSPDVKARDAVVTGCGIEQ